LFYSSLLGAVTVPFSRKFSVISEISHIEVIARGTGVDIRRFLSQRYGENRWRKLKGRAWIEYENGCMAFTEIHWFEAHGIGQVQLKIVREFKSDE
jgi:hypothetical protein